MTRALNRLFGSLITETDLRKLYGDPDEATAQDLATFLTGGTGALINDWVIDGADPLDPEELADRLLGLSTVLARSHPTPLRRHPE
jgi:hypothetical protein